MLKALQKARYLNHDINNGLGIALGYTDILLQSEELKDNPYLNKILSNLLRTSELSVELSKTCATMSDDEINNVPDGFSVILVKRHFQNNIPKAVVDLRQRFNISIDTSFTSIEEDKFVCINPEEIARVRENIISNAVDAGATHVQMDYKMSSYGLIVTISDNGKGMSGEEIDKLQLKMLGDGTVHGLGTKSILETAKSHHMPLTYHSQLGEGTTIRALVPYYQP